MDASKHISTGSNKAILRSVHPVQELSEDAGHVFSILREILRNRFQKTNKIHPSFLVHCQCDECIQDFMEGYQRICKDETVVEELRYIQKAGFGNA